MTFPVSKAYRILFLAPICSLLTGCAVEQWKLSTLAHNRDFEIRKPSELFEQPVSAGLATNRLLHLEPGANHLYYAYDSKAHALEITVPVNRDNTVTVTGSGKQIRISNFKRLSRSIRLRDSTGGPKIGASVVIPPGQSLAEEQKLTLLLGVSLDQSLVGHPEPKRELAVTLQSVVVYDYGRDVVLAEWTRQAEPESRPPRMEESPADNRVP